MPTLIIKREYRVVPPRRDCTKPPPSPRWLAIAASFLLGFVLGGAFVLWVLQ